IIVAEEEVWKYNDRGEELASNWMSAEYGIETWNEGQAELGYGDGDENTVLSYGGDSGNKHITTYFRKTFSVENTSAVQNLKVRLKCDDGAIVYLNGVEVARENLPSGEISHQTKALSAVGGSSESDFTTYSIEISSLDTGMNTIAVELHQSSGTSSDISFALELSTVIFNTNEFISTNPNLKFIHNKGEGLVAVFESDGSCILPEEITAEMILNKECSPYKVSDNVTVTSTGKLIIEPGVELWMSDDVSIEINGSMVANGTEGEPVIFRSNPGASNKKWGILNFVNADTSSLINVVIEDASQGNHPLREIAAVSVFHSVLTLDGVVIENVYANPVVARYSDVKMVNSKLHSEITGDLINIKYGKGFIDNCEFVGNNLPDTDAIDFDDITDGVIQNCVIYNFIGFNSDGIDIGEKAKNITMKNVAAYNITDKGISVGQQSSGTISNSIFVNCNLGIGLKDSSRVIIDHCTFYGNQTSIACYEKNAGDAGGNAIVTNSILSNVYDATYISDSRSTINISNSVSDNFALPAGEDNLFANPQFRNPNLFDFSLTNSSPCVAAGTDGNIGASLAVVQHFNQLFISAIAYKSDITSEVNEFVELTNSGNTVLDISWFEFTKGITFRFPEGSMIKPGRKVYITYNSGSGFWQNKGQVVYQWESGRLADEGETIQLETPDGIIIDNIEYSSTVSWPVVLTGEGISLVSEDVDNHFGNNWEVLKLNTIVGINDLSDETEIKFYPNPTTGIVHFTGLNEEGSLLNVYNLTGIKVIAKEINSTNSQVDLRSLPQGIYLLQFGSFSQRVILRK
ncbi:MAG: lamin tail domain-containing protein, partial [Bacteroidetes bacterium]|nr:lamin tail domain-containing protein [Bacteroidota bacterium]